MKLKCVAKISSVYWQSNEESVESDKHQKIPVLESRETVVPKSRLLDKTLEDGTIKDKNSKSGSSSSSSNSEINGSSGSSSNSGSSGSSSSLYYSNHLYLTIQRMSFYALPILIALSQHDIMSYQLISLDRR